MVRSAFFEFNVALSGLYTAKGGIQTVGHNIANAATPGYSKQYAELRASTPLTYHNGKGMIGTGSEVYGVGQLRDFYLDKKYWSERAVLGEYSVKTTQLNLMEGVFNELSTSGTNATFDRFFQRLQDLTTTSGDDTYRANVIQAGQELATFVNSVTESLKKQQRDVNEEVRTVVQIINTIGYQIRSLNEQISKFEMDGSKANDLRDQRAVLIDELSQYVNVEVKETELNEEYAKGLHPEPEDRCLSDKEFSIMINGYEFIKGWDIIQLKVEERDLKTNPMDVPGLYDIYFEGSNVKFDIYDPELQGQLKGLIDIRDGNNGHYLSSTDDSKIVFSSTNTVDSITVPGSATPPPPASGYVTVMSGATEVGKYYYITDPDTGDFVFTNSTDNTEASHVLLSDIEGYTLVFDNGTTIASGDVTANQPTVDTITVTDVTRVDLDKTGGYVTVTDPKTGLPVKYKYSSMSVDANGKVTFTIDKSTPIKDSHIKTFPGEVYSGKTDSYKGIPHYLDRLNELVRTVAQAFNEGIPDAGVTGHMYGYDANEEKLGLLFFSYKADVISGNIDYTELTCENFQMNSALLDDPKLLAAAMLDTSGIDDNNIIHGFLKIQDFKSLFTEGRLSDFIVGTASELGIDNRQAANFESNYTDITTTIENQRMSVSGVDLNEEFADLLKYQQIYVACAKLLNVINEIYDVTINRMGL